MRAPGPAGHPGTDYLKTVVNGIKAPGYPCVSGDSLVAR